MAEIGEKKKASEPKKDPMGWAEPWNASGESTRDKPYFLFELCRIYVFISYMYLTYIQRTILHFINIILELVYYLFLSLFSMVEPRGSGKK